MIKKKLLLTSVVSILTLSIFILSCEKDDICSGETETTPKLIIRFYDTDNPDNTKNVSNIRVQGVGNDNVVGDLDGSVSTDSIALPLKTNESFTEFSIYKDYSDDGNGNISGNEDIIRVSYNHKEVYVSRACGYKQVFEQVIISVEDDGDKWIDYTETVEQDFQNVENERAAHYKIFH